jgi:hypothetical protein
MSNKNKKVERPLSPPPPLFFGKKERDYVKQTIDEVVESVIGQTIVYYPIDLEKSNFHALYGEAINKIFLSPVRVYCLVEWTGPKTTTTNYGIDRVYEPIKVHFHKRRLTEDQDLFVREGDFIAYGDSFYEITDLEEPRELFGQNKYRVEITALCTKAREELFDAS